MTTASASAPAGTSPAAHAPGLRFEFAATSALPPVRRSAGQTLFVGFGQARHAAPARLLEIGGWEHFHARVATPAEGYLAPAVRGFFANGGERCLVWPVGPDRSAAALAAPFAPGGLFEDDARIGLVCVPDAVRADAGGLSLQELQRGVLQHCEATGDRFAILDAAPFRRASPARLDAVQAQAGWSRSAFGAIYFPWLRVERPVHTDSAELVPPCGHVAGLYARIDARSGVHKAPANETLSAVLAVDCPVDAGQHGRLNEASVNCIVATPGRGIRVWGARTLSGQSTWRYVSTARLFIELRRWLEGNLRDIVFESQTPELRDRVRRRIVLHCLELQRSNALAGTGGAAAFVVKCDEENNPPEVRAAGQIVADIGLSVSTPAEFVVVRVTNAPDRVVVTRL